jgi:hypothetical protein
VVGVLFVGVFCAVLFAYACTEYLLIRFDVRRRIRIGKCGWLTVLAVNIASLAVVWISSAVLVAASGHDLHLQAAVIAVGAPLIWCTELLWFYHRDHLHVGYEN